MISFRKHFSGLLCGRALKTERLGISERFKSCSEFSPLELVTAALKARSFSEVASLVQHLIF